MDAQIGTMPKQVVEYLIALGRPTTEFETAIEKLKTGFHLHTDPKEGKLHYTLYDMIEKLLAREAEMAPDDRIDNGIWMRLARLPVFSV